MKYVAVILAMVLVAGVTVTVFVLAGSSVTVSLAGNPEVVDASSNRALFAQMAQAAGYDLDGDDAVNYKFVTWRIILRNGTRIPLEMAEATILTKAGDVARVDNATGITVRPGEDGALSVTILTRGEVTPGHEIIVSWYLWGKSYQQTLTV